MSTRCSSTFFLLSLDFLLVQLWDLLAHTASTCAYYYVLLRLLTLQSQQQQQGRRRRPNSHWEGNSLSLGHFPTWNEVLKREHESSRKHKVLVSFSRPKKITAKGFKGFVIYVSFVVVCRGCFKIIFCQLIFRHFLWNAGNCCRKI